VTLKAPCNDLHTAQRRLISPNAPPVLSTMRTVPNYFELKFTPDVDHSLKLACTENVIAILVSGVPLGGWPRR
jgi:hypothetical protein